MNYKENILSMSGVKEVMLPKPTEPFVTAIKYHLHILIDRVSEQKNWLLQ